MVHVHPTAGRRRLPRLSTFVIVASLMSRGLRDTSTRARAVRPWLWLRICGNGELAMSERVSGSSSRRGRSGAAHSSRYKRCGYRRRPAVLDLATGGGAERGWLPGRSRSASSLSCVPSSRAQNADVGRPTTPRPRHRQRYALFAIMTCSVGRNPGLGPSGPGALESGDTASPRRHPRRPARRLLALMVDLLRARPPRTVRGRSGRDLCLAGYKHRRIRGVARRR